MAELANPQHERFCHEYVVDFNATEAAKRANYSARTAYSQGFRLLKKAEIQQRVSELARASVEKADVDAAWTGQRLKWLADARLRDTCSWDPETGLTVIPSDELPPEVEYAIREVHCTTVVMASKKGTQVLKTTLKVKLHDKQKALHHLDQRLGVLQGGGIDEDGGHRYPVALPPVRELTLHRGNGKTGTEG